MIFTEQNQNGSLVYLNVLQTVGLHFQYGKFKYFYYCGFFYNVYKLNIKIFSIDTNIYGDDDNHNNDCLLYFNSKQYGYL